MTLDEAIIHCEEVADKCDVTDGNIKCANEHRQLAGWLKDYKRLKEQEPCNDAISRAQAIYVASGYCHPANVARELEKLPSVIPQPKTGHWVDVFGGCECSECGYTEAGYSDYCPNCGAKMVEPQERKVNR